MSIIRCNLVLLADELVSLIFYGSDAWAKSFQDVDDDDDHHHRLLLLKPIDAVEESLIKSLNSLNGHAEFADALTKLAQIVVKIVIAKERRHDDELDRFGVQLEVSMLALMLFGQKYLAVSIIEQWNALIEKVNVTLMTLVTAMFDNDELRRPPLSTQPQAHMWRLRLLNAFSDIGKMIEAMPPLLS